MKLTKINKLKIFLLCGPHLDALGPQNFLSRAAFHLKVLRARGFGRRFTFRRPQLAENQGPQFADP